MPRHADPQPAEPIQSGPRMQIPNPPAAVSRLAAAEIMLRAQQAAERGIATGAVDATSVEANLGALPGVAEIHAQADEYRAALHAQRADTKASGATLVVDAELGRHVDPEPLARSVSVAGLEIDLQDAADEASDASGAHEILTDVMAGERTWSDGTTRVGEPAAPEARSTPEIRRAIRTENVKAMVPVAVPLLVEGVAVAYNMHAYMRADDSLWWVAPLIAVITVCVLTLSPFLLGTVANDIVHGARPGLLARWLYGAAAAVWLGVGVTLALVRVQVDQLEAVRAAREQRDSDVRLAQAMGTPVDSIPEVDPGAVFNPVLPSVFWIIVFVGFGIVLMLWECLHRNPVRMAELHARGRLVNAQTTLIALTAQLAAVKGSVQLQHTVNGHALEMWDGEDEVITAVTARAEAVHERTLGEASGDPAMPLALTAHRAARLANGVR